MMILEKYMGNILKKMVPGGHLHTNLLLRNMLQAVDEIWHKEASR